MKKNVFRDEILTLDGIPSLKGYAMIALAIAAVIRPLSMWQENRHIYS